MKWFYNLMHRLFPFDSDYARTKAVLQQLNISYTELFTRQSIIIDTGTKSIYFHADGKFNQTIHYAPSDFDRMHHYLKLMFYPHSRISLTKIQVQDLVFYFEGPNHSFSGVSKCSSQTS